MHQVKREKVTDPLNVALMIPAINAAAAKILEKHKGDLTKLAKKPKAMRAAELEARAIKKAMIEPRLSKYDAYERLLATPTTVMYFVHPRRLRAPRQGPRARQAQARF